MRRLAKYYAKTLVHGASARSRRMLGGARARRASLTIFTYHSFCVDAAPQGFSSLRADMFARQIRLLCKSYRLVSLVDGLRAIEQAAGDLHPMAAITIDDGFEDNYRVAWPVLKRHAAPATIFLATDFLDTGRAPWPTRLWDIVNAMKADQPAALYARLQTKLRTLNADARRVAMDDLIAEHKLDGLPARSALTWDQVREMASSGIAFGSHTVDHGYLPSLAPPETVRELVESKRRIEQELQYECACFAYPNGDWCVDTAARVRGAGYHAAVTQDFGSNSRGQNPHALMRVEVPSDDPLASFDHRALRALATTTAPGFRH